VYECRVLLRVILEMIVSILFSLLTVLIVLSVVPINGCYLLNQGPNSYNILWSIQGPFLVPGCCIARLPFLLALTMFYVLHPSMNITV
jgi:hypothetical protein